MIIDINATANFKSESGKIFDVTLGCTLGIITTIGTIRVSASFFCPVSVAVSDIYELIGEADAGINGSVYNEYLSNNRLATIYQQACNDNQTSMPFVGNQLMFLRVETGPESLNIGSVGLKIGFENVFDPIDDMTTITVQTTTTSSTGNPPSSAPNPLHSKKLIVFVIMFITVVFPNMISMIGYY